MNGIFLKKLYICPVCGNDYSRKDALKKHINQLHPQPLFPDETATPPNIEMPTSSSADNLNTTGSMSDDQIENGNFETLQRQNLELQLKYNDLLKKVSEKIKKPTTLCYLNFNIYL